ncbi:hypothetical protein SEA_PUPPER_112 [Gordonia phage Pupper]|uniref:Uncharacterized protein n=1 Tax=Gordonia phage Pupper TaxID=2571249 RepID=A0A4Y6EIN9_9CAUD|nr:hypothetical protein KHQ83_gp165 [Gordonia phage Pupper]QDF18598.1 hypothetical protein SEA_PUPPER_112 [Gordonia phage Pupper]QDF18830.1 hypothetical protein SEA_SCENTAE_111 [Gordonia phage SCentae]
MTDAITRTNEPMPESGGGMIEATKRAVIVGLRDAIKGSTLNNLVNGSEITVDMEYPLIEEKYPGIWVQFSFTKIINSGVGWEQMLVEIENEGQADEKPHWMPVREFMFEGRATLTIVALTSLERDRIADAVVSMLMFSRPPETDVVYKGTKQFRQLLTTLARNPYISMTINTDQIIPGGQATTTGVPWDPEILGYEDSYSFDLLGQSNIIFRHDGTYELKRIDVAHEVVVPEPYDWQ